MLAALVLVLASACLHAGWNLLAHRRGESSGLLYKIPLVVAAAGLAPALVAELREPALTPSLLGLLALTGGAQAVYYLALSRAYQASDFSLAYPLSRALPVLLLAAVDAARGRSPGALGLAGMALVVAGCLLAPLPGLGAFSPRRYWSRATAWIVVIALATVAFSVVDKLALEALPRRPDMAARYAVWEAVATAPWVARLATRDAPRERGAGWGWALVAAAFSFASYGLVLLAYQLSDQTSYVAALRQVSIPLGVAGARALLGERATPLRVAASAAVTAGVACVLAGGG